MPTERLEQALRSPEPARALPTLVLELHHEGHSKAEIYSLLDNFLVHLRQAESYRDSDEDVLLDVLDALTCWCHPDAQLLSDSP
jgi:hypothetical protein